ncbi:hypothetical protein [Burkholderia ubonensis]|uniref:hypothetical protein n=1 Tax=Burkholderia ubonensis TaxID=101571 RepID=UPI000AFAD290|nr:hypothetical protein [Burkholderia ubonensis]
MGRHANARAWAEYERLQAKSQDEYFEPTEPLSEAERAAEWEEFEGLRDFNADFDRIFGGPR